MQHHIVSKILLVELKVQFFQTHRATKGLTKIHIHKKIQQEHTGQNIAKQHTSKQNEKYYNYTMLYKYRAF